MEKLELKLSSRLYRLTKVLDGAGVNYTITDDCSTVVLPLEEELTVVIGDNLSPGVYEPNCYSAVCLAESSEHVQKEYEGYVASKPISLRLATWACRERSKETGIQEFGVSSLHHTLYEIKSALKQYLSVSDRVLN